MITHSDEAESHTVCFKHSQAGSAMLRAGNLEPFRHVLRGPAGAAWVGWKHRCAKHGYWKFVGCELNRAAGNSMLRKPGPPERCTKPHLPTHLT